MDNKELYEKTRRLLHQLDHFIVHVIVYFVVNVVLVLTAFVDIQSRWWILFFVTLWAFLLIYHGLYIYGIDIFKRKNKKLNQFWSWV